jgi:hypothetical protein
MDNYKVSKPQFNVTVFNRVVCITANRRFVQELLGFIKTCNSFCSDYSDFCDDLTQLMADEEDSTFHGGDYSVTRFKHVYSVSMETEAALDMSRRILEDASYCCERNKDVSLPTFVAFGRKLKDAGEGNFQGLQPNSRGPIREIIVRREIIR